MNRFYQLLCLAAFMVGSSGFTDNSEVAQSNQKMNNGYSDCCPKPKPDCCPKPKPDCCPKPKPPCCPKPKPDCCPRPNCCPPKECCPPRVCEKMFEQGLGLPCGKYPCAYNAPAGISLRCAWDWFVTGSFIYWHVSQDGMDFAYVAPNSSTLALSHSGAVAFQDFKYKPGFKVGLGMKLDHDDWVLRAQYTWLHQRVTDSTGTPPDGVTVWTTNDWFTPAFSQEPATDVSSAWRTKFDMVDVVMERPFYQGTMLTVNPYGGMRALWLRQKFNLTATGAPAATFVTATSNNRSNSWALGPTTGVGGHWLLGEGFRFEGNAAASILYTRYTKISNNIDSSTSLPASSSVRKFNCLRPSAELGVGVGWGMYTCNNEFYFDIALDYEFLYFWDQNVMRMFVSNLNGELDDISAFQMHGLTVTLRFDF